MEYPFLGGWEGEGEGRGGEGRGGEGGIPFHRRTVKTPLRQLFVSHITFGWRIWVLLVDKQLST